MALPPYMGERLSDYYASTQNERLLGLQGISNRYWEGIHDSGNASEKIDTLIQSFHSIKYPNLEVKFFKDPQDQIAAKIFLWHGDRKVDFTLPYLNIKLGENGVPLASHGSAEQMLILQGLGKDYEIAVDLQKMEAFANSIAIEKDFTDSAYKNLGYSRYTGNQQTNSVNDIYLQIVHKTH